MATIEPPPAKRLRREAAARSREQQDVSHLISDEVETVRVRFHNGDGARFEKADVVEMSRADMTDEKLSRILHALLGRTREEFTPYRFTAKDEGSSRQLTLTEFLEQHGAKIENEISLIATSQDVFKVQAVTRLAHRIPGHGKAILTAQFSPESSSRFVTGSGDNTARIWDTDTGTPHRTLAGHTGHVIVVAWSPDAARIATGSKDKLVMIWDPVTGQQVGQPFRGHVKIVMDLAWEPYHLWREGTPRLASASQDHTVRVWVVNSGRMEHVLSGHKDSVACVRWGGAGLIYSASHDKTIKIWNSKEGTLAHTLSAHAHWVNHLALSSDFVLRTGYFDQSKAVPDTEEGKRAKARERFEKAARAASEDGEIRERLVSASDDFTIYLWDPATKGTKPVARMMGHGKQVNNVMFSPDGRLIASAGWDNHTKIWNARDGKYIDTLRGHVGPVYQCVFSADSRLLATSSKDTTVKVWDMRTFKLASDLPGHEDEVYALDWSPDGKRVGSGGRDKAIRLWRN